MKVVDSNALLEVGTSQLTRALKHLLRVGTLTELARLKYDSGILTVSIGRASQDVPAIGAWSQTVSVERTWAEALASTPNEGAITLLRHSAGKLWARDFGVKCPVELCTERSEELVKREEDLQRACQILARFNVTRQDVNALMEEADSATARLWGPDEAGLIDDIAREWKRLAMHGVEPSDIRRLIDCKSRALWKGGRKSGTLFVRYNVTEREKRDLIESGTAAKAELWGRNDAWLIDEIALAWKHLVTYGVEPSNIRRLVNTKSR
jgi:hypothetical protein